MLHLKGVFSYINESDTSFPDCKYKHMVKNGAPFVKFGVLYRQLHIEIHGFNSRIDVLGLTHLGFWYLLNSLTDSMGPFLNVDGKITFCALSTSGDSITPFCFIHV